MSQAEKANHFAALHKKNDPVVLYNIWDAGGAKTLAKAGAQAVATGSWSVAAAHGFTDGEAIPLDFVVMIVERICTTVDVPVTVDFEGGYAVDADDLAQNVRRIIGAGAIGINFEDRVVQGAGLHPVATQVERIKAIRAVAEAEGVPLFINARTDLFLGTDPETHRDRVSEAKERQVAYAAAGASGFFIPGLTDTALITEIVEAASLPVNVMMGGAFKTIEQLAGLGVSRASFGPIPFVRANSDLKNRFSEV